MQIYQNNFLILSFILLLVMLIDSVFTKQHGKSIPLTTLNRNPLQGRHLKIIANLLLQDHSVSIHKQTGVLEEIIGGTGHFLVYLTSRYNFTYSIVQDIKATSVLSEGRNGSKGLIDYLIEEESDLLVGYIFMTSSRYAVVDMTHPWLSVSMFLLNGNPTYQANITSVAKPFQWPVWVAIFFSIVFAMGTSHLFSHFLSSPVFCQAKGIKSNQDKIIIKRSNKSIQVPYLYTFGLLLFQGGQCPSKRLSIRLFAGTWCLAAIVLSNCYSSVLITYVLAPIRGPIINSVYDIVKDNDAKLVVEKGRGYDNVISTSTEDHGVFKQLRDKLDSNPRFRCKPRTECVALVNSGTKTVFGTGYELVAKIIDNDYKRTGKCVTLMGQEGFLSSPISWMLPKNSPYTQTLNKGILEILNTGIYSYWKNKEPGISNTVPQECQISAKKSSASVKAGTNHRLSLNNLTGAFIILVIGHGVVAHNANTLIKCAEDVGYTISFQYMGAICMSAPVNNCFFLTPQFSTN